ncbi:hypothetical protein ACFRFD_39825, partial [Streptomyces sp. NPDC056632]
MLVFESGVPAVSGTTTVSGRDTMPVSLPAPVGVSPAPDAEAGVSPAFVTTGSADVTVVTVSVVTLIPAPASPSPRDPPDPDDDPESDVPVVPVVSTLAASHARSCR